MRLLLPVLLLICAPVFAQNRAATEQRLTSLRSQIAGVEEQVRRVRSQEQDALLALEGMQTEIALREELVFGYRVQLDSARSEASALQRSILRLEDEIERARDSYRERARHAYMRGSISDLSLVLSAGSIPQMIARARYLKQFAERRRHQVSRISASTAELKQREQELQASSRETQHLLTTSQFEQSEISARKREREGLVQEVRRNRTNLEAELAERRNDVQSLEGIVAELVAQERRREEERRLEEQRRIEEQRRLDEAARQATASRRAQEAQRASAQRTAAATSASSASRRAIEEPSPTISAPAAPLPPASDRIVSLTGSFRQNRGQLPRPTDGPVTGAFGTRTDPVYGTRITSPGIDISTPPAAGVRAVFEGVVERVGAMSTFGTYVMISHGSYTTIYGNLSSVGVSQGQRVQAGQLLGRSGTSEQRRGAALFFAIFEGETAVDPNRWLR